MLDRAAPGEVLRGGLVTTETERAVLLLGTQRATDDGVLEIGSMSAIELAERYGTPLYVIDEWELRSRCRAYRDAFAAAYPGETLVAYAAKALSSLAVCRIVDQEGLWLDVASGGELHCALRADFPPSKIVFHGNNKSDEELRMALDAGIALDVIDCLEELDAIQRLAGERGTVARVPALIRLDPGIECHTHHYVKTGTGDSKFGFSIPAGAAHDAIAAALATDAIDLRGFHCHIGSQILALDCFRDTVEAVLDLCDFARSEYDYEPAVVNVGGGLGVRHRADEKPPAIGELAEVIGTALAEGCRARGMKLPSLMVEPGRSIIGEAGTILYRVGAVKRISDVRTYVAVDGGLSDNPRPALYGARYEVLFAGRMHEPPTQSVTVAGKHCESDTLFPDVPAPDVQPGDIIAVPACGAYTFAMSSNYNRLPRPAMVLVNDGVAEVIVRRQTYDDLLVGESIPARLA